MSHFQGKLRCSSSELRLMCQVSPQSYMQSEGPLKQHIRLDTIIKNKIKLQHLELQQSQGTNKNQNSIIHLH